MIKFLFMTDPHIKGKSPSTRIDDFTTTMELKLKDFFSYGHEQNVDFFVCGGDFVDSPYTSARFAKRVGKLIKENLKGKELFFVWGNHDIVAWNPRTIDDTSFGLFQAFAEEMVLLSEVPIKRTYRGQTIELSGVSSYSRLDRDELDDEGVVTSHRSRDYIVDNETGTPRIHVVHGYLSPKPILDEIPHTVIEDMRSTGASITLTGHEHTGFPVTKIDNGLVYNPGALGRVFASHTEMNRMPKYALCTIDDNNEPNIEPVQCRVAKIGTDVMDRTKLDEKKLQEQILLETKGSIRDVLAQINIGNIDLQSIISRFKDEVREEVYVETKRRLKI